jgi:hypothetical protein
VISFANYDRHGVKGSEQADHGDNRNKARRFVLRPIGADLSVFHAIGSRIPLAGIAGA